MGKLHVEVGPFICECAAWKGCAVVCWPVQPVQVPALRRVGQKALQPQLNLYSITRVVKFVP